MSEKKSSGAGRTRNWNMLVYPGSAPENWREKIDEYHIPWVESCLHDKDVYEDGEHKGEYKKPHIHVTLLFRGVKTYEQIRELTDSINAPRPEKCHDARGSIRYMRHLDHPEKCQYADEPIGHGGADLMTLCAPTSGEIYEIKCAIEEFICEHGIVEYSVLLDRLRFEGKRDMHNVAQSNTLYCNAYIASKRNIFEKLEKAKKLEVMKKQSEEINESMQRAEERTKEFMEQHKLNE